jgi:hypothetical protein
VVVKEEDEALTSLRALLFWGDMYIAIQTVYMGGEVFHKCLLDSKDQSFTCLVVPLNIECHEHTSIAIFDDAKQYQEEFSKKLKVSFLNLKKPI